MAETDARRPEGRVVLVTGVSRDLGRRCARALADDPSVRRVIGVDVAPPRGDVGGMSFVRADIRGPVIAKVMAAEDVDTVVHLGVISTPGSTGGRAAMKELNVLGTMQLLAACQKSSRVQTLVVKSTTTVYGASSRDPAMFTEGMEPRRVPRSGYAKDVAEIEGYVRGFARRRPDCRVTTLRCANVVGPHVLSPLTSYLRLPVVPRPLGYDPRLQVLHEDDLQAAVLHTVLRGLGGTFNVAGDGVLTLSQVLRRLQRPSVPLPSQAMGRLGSAFPGGRSSDFSPELLALLAHGRGVDTTAMREVLGFEPHFTTAGAVADFATTLPPTGGRVDHVLGAIAGHLPAAPDVRRPGGPLAAVPAGADPASSGGRRG